MMRSGSSPDEVARIFDVSRAIAYRWNQQYEKHGASALEIKKAPGRTASLTFEQRGNIFALIAGSNPAQMQLDFGELWTRKNVREMIRREFGVRLSDVQVGRVLRDIGLSPQKPLYRSYKQNPELVEEWKKVIYPRIRARAAAEGAQILFGDEASVRTDHHAGTTWAPVGQTPVVRDSGKRQAGQNDFSNFPAGTAQISGSPGVHERRPVHRVPQGFDQEHGCGKDFPDRRRQFCP